MFEMHGNGKRVAVFMSETGAQEITLNQADAQIEVVIVFASTKGAGKEVLDYADEAAAELAFNEKVKAARQWAVNVPEQPSVPLTKPKAKPGPKPKAAPKE